MRLFGLLAIVLWLGGCTESSRTVRTVRTGKLGGATYEVHYETEIRNNTPKETRTVLVKRILPDGKWQRVENETEWSNVVEAAFVQSWPVVNEGPNAVAQDVKSYVYLAQNGGNSDILIIDPANATIFRRLLVGAYISSLVVSDARAEAFAAVQRPGGQEIRVIDCVTNQFTRTLSVPAGVEIVALAASPDGRVLYALNGGSPGGLRLIDPVSGQEVANVAAPQGVPFSNTARMLASPDGDLVFAQGGFSLQVFDTLTRSWVATIAAGGSGPIRINPNGREIYASRFASSTRQRIEVIDVATATVSAGIDLPNGESVQDLSVNFDGMLLSVTTDKSAHLIHTRTRQITDSLPRAAGSQGVKGLFVRLPQ